MEIRPYRDGDEEPIRRLFAEAFGQAMSSAFWRWRFLQNPAADQGPIIHLAWDGDTLAGHYAVSPARAIAGGTEQMVALSMTTMTASAYRGQGLFTTLAESVYAEMRERDFALVYGFPNEASHRSFVGQLAWADVYEVPMMSVAARRRSADAIEGVSRIDRFTTSTTEFVAEALAEYDFWIVRDARQLNWRYCDHPELEYVCFVSEREGHRGYLVCKVYDGEGAKQLDIVDVVAASPAAARDLIIAAESYALAEGASKVNLWMNRRDASFPQIERLGYAHSSPVTWLGYRPITLGRAPSRLATYDAWYVTMGDSDVY